MLPNRATYRIYGSTLVTFTMPFPTTKVEFVANKAKGRITKRVLQVNKARSIFRKTNVSYPLIHASKRIRGFKFGKFGPLFSCDTRFEVHPFSLLPTNFKRTAALIKNL